MSDTKATVADTTDAGANAQAQDAGGQVDDLESLLKEHQGSRSPPTTTEKPKVTVDDVAEVVQYVRTEAGAKASDKAERDFESLLTDTVMKDEEISGLDPRLVRAELRLRVYEDPRIRAAWVDRDKNPDRFAAIAKAVAKSLKPESQPDLQLTENRTAFRESALAAARGSTKPSPPADLGKAVKTADARTFAQMERDTYAANAVKRGL